MAGISIGLQVFSRIDTAMLNHRIRIIVSMEMTLQIRYAVFLENNRDVRESRMRPPSSGYIGSKL